jgi:glucose/arabinose dehydrogenase
MDRRFSPSILLFLLLFSPTLFAQTITIALEPVATGFTEPLFFTNAKDGTDRRLVVEQRGRILVLQPSASASPVVFLDITSRVLSGGERGLLGLAFHPQFSTNGRFFVNYTRRPDGATVIAEYRLSASNNNVADDFETILLTIPQPFENHNGGMIEFGPDGYLYIGVGDGGLANDPRNRAQDLNDLLGKILRLNVDEAGSAPSIFAYGFRNPWRFSFDRASGLLYAGDVGQNAREEVDIVRSGGNYGWRIFEGTLCTNLGATSCTAPGFIPPVAEYGHSEAPGRCSITGGYVYRGRRGSLPVGAYVYGDLCSGEIFMLKDGGQTILLDTALSISSFGEDEAGEIYVVNHGGSIHRITNPLAAARSSLAFAIPDRGQFIASTAGGEQTLRVGYARVQPDSGRITPPALGLFQLQQKGIVISETSISSSPAIQSGRIFAEVGNNVNTGLAIVNPNGQPATVSFFFTDGSGNNIGQGSTTLAPDQQLTAFLDQRPFNGRTLFSGTFTFSSSLVVSVAAVRAFTNERSDVLLTTIPVVPLGISTSLLVSLPHFADGGGWSTQVVLVNPGEDAISGSVQFVGREGETLRTSSYLIAARSSTRIQTNGGGGAVQVGSVRLVPQTSLGIPVPFGIFSYRSAGVTVTETAVFSLRNSTAFRIYAEFSGTVDTGLAIANPSTSPVTVRVELTHPDGTSTALAALIDVPANGQRSLFLGEIPEFSAFDLPFQGMLRLTSPALVSVTSLHVRTNERGDFIISAISPIDELMVGTSAELFLPHFAEGQGYSMQFAVLGRLFTTSSGVITFFDQAGQPVNLLFR